MNMYVNMLLNIKYLLGRQPATHTMYWSLCMKPESQCTVHQAHPSRMIFHHLGLQVNLIQLKQE